MYDYNYCTYMRNYGNCHMSPGSHGKGTGPFKRPNCQRRFAPFLPSPHNPPQRTHRMYRVICTILRK